MPWKLILMAGVSAALFISGFGAAEVFEHRPATSMPFFGNSLKAQLSAAQDLAAINANNSNNWMHLDQACETKAKTENDNQTAVVTQNSTAADQRSSSAWNNGYSAGKVAGARSCGVNHNAPTPTVAGSQPSVDSVLNDLSIEFNAGAYTPTAAVPAQR